MEATGLLTRRTALAILAAIGALLLATPAAEAVFAGKPGRIAYSAELPGENKTRPDPNPPPGFFLTIVDRGFDVFTVNPDGRDSRRLTQNGAEPNDEHEPAWSPDGTLIAFSAIFPFKPQPHTNLTPESRIDVMAPDGSGRRTVTSGGYIDVPAFSQDGSRLFYRWTVSDLLSRGVSSVDLNGANRRQEDPRLFDYYGSHVSPDGRHKVFASMDGDVFLSKLDGSEARNLTQSSGVPEFDPALAPDMSAVVFARDDPAPPPNVASSIVVLDLETGAERTISPPGLFATAPDWGSIPVNCGGRRATLVGTSGRDKLVGTKADDVIAGLGGRDKISGKGGKDRLCGGSGRDRLSGGKGKKDRCLGGKGRDEAKGCERSKSA